MFVIKGLTGSVCDRKREGASLYDCLYPVHKRELCVTSISVLYVISSSIFILLDSTGILLYQNHSILTLGIIGVAL